MSRSDIVNELFKPARKNFERRKIVVKSIDDLLELDLMDMQQISKENDSYRYILAGINCFSKKGFAIPIKNKTAATVAEATKQLLALSKTNFKNVHTDKGSEFRGAFQKLMTDTGQNHYFSHSEMKAAICERFIRTLKQRIYKKMALRGNWRYIDVLDDIVKDYNNTKHRTIKMAPNEVNKKNEKRLLNTVFNYKRPVVKTKFKVGDTVRVSKKNFVFQKGYFPSWSTELFIVHKVNPKYPPTYILSNFDGSEVIQGQFYEFELQKTKNKDLYLVERVLKKKGNKVFVKWAGFSDQYNSWVDADEVFDAEN